MEPFMESCKTALEYPQNLIYHSNYEHHLQAYAERLKAQAPRLFCEDSEAALLFWQINDPGQGFRLKTMHTVDDVRQQLCLSSPGKDSDPLCRYVFVHSRNSRDRLRCGWEMLMLALTYHQVMPAFIDLLFPFGRQLYAQDFHFSGFWQDTRLSRSLSGPAIPEMGRSGRDIRICYGLSSVESSQVQKSWPWSIRKTAVYHSFDLESGRAVWVIVKGNTLMKERVMSTFESSSPLKLSSTGTIGQVFAQSLETHLIVLDWSSESWRWYINFLEEEFQEAARRALSTLIDPPSIPATDEGVSWAPQVTPPRICQTSVSQTVTLSPSKSTRQCMPPVCPPLATSSPRQPPELPHGWLGQHPPDSQKGFSFKDLQRIQYIEDKANEALLVLRTNAKVLNALKQHYRFTTDSPDFPQHLIQNQRERFVRFENGSDVVGSDLHMQQSRLKTLLRLLADRKNLIHAILTHQATEASKLVAEKAQISSLNMEKITREMHYIAQKTKQETVSMRIITLVTLFFLPGTFISTLMSTDIVRFEISAQEKTQKVFQPAALHLFAAVTLPLMFATFSAWYGVYWWVNRTENSASLSKMPKLDV